MTCDLPAKCGLSRWQGEMSECGMVRFWYLWRSGQRWIMEQNILLSIRPSVPGSYCGCCGLVHREMHYPSSLLVMQGYGLFMVCMKPPPYFNYKWMAGYGEKNWKMSRNNCSFFHLPLQLIIHWLIGIWPKREGPRRQTVFLISEALEFVLSLDLLSSQTSPYLSSDRGSLAFPLGLSAVSKFGLSGMGDGFRFAGLAFWLHDSRTGDS